MKKILLVVLGIKLVCATISAIPAVNIYNKSQYFITASAYHEGQQTPFFFGPVRPKEIWHIDFDYFFKKHVIRAFGAITYHMHTLYVGPYKYQFWFVNGTDFFIQDGDGEFDSCRARQLHHLDRIVFNEQGQFEKIDKQEA